MERCEKRPERGTKEELEWIKQNNVHKPNHYTDKKIEVIDYIKDTLTEEEFIGFCTGNVIKYVSRWRKKGGIEDLEKAKVYLNWAIERVKECTN